MNKRIKDHWSMLQEMTSTNAAETPEKMISELMLDLDKRLKKLEK